MPLPSAAARIPFERLLGWLATALVFVGIVAGGVVLGGGARWVIGVPDLPGVLILVGVIVLALLGGLGHLLVRAVSRREAVVGTDVVVVRGTFSRQLVPFSDVARVVCDRRGVRIARRGARDVLLRTPGAEWRPLRDTDPPPGAACSAAEARRDALLDRVRAARPSSVSRRRTRDAASGTRRWPPRTTAYGSRSITRPRANSTRAS